MISNNRKSPAVIMALGNPGAEYENTYHNAGVLALPYLIQALAGENSETLGWKTCRKLFEYAKITPLARRLATSSRLKGRDDALRGEEIVFVRSLTFMNESGVAAAEALKKFGAKPEGLVIVHDDSDLALGHFKISFDRSSGGHKGAQSVIDHLKTQAFTRVRIGVRPADEQRRKKAGDFVLAKIKPADKKTLAEVFEKIAATLAEALNHDP